MTTPAGSTGIPELVAALSKFQGAMTSVPKTSENPFFNMKYADLGAIWDMCRKPLADNDLALVQTTVVDGEKVYLDTTLYHKSGQSITGRYPITPMKQVQGQGWAPSNDPQSIGSALTYARRYAMSAMLGISSDADDDGEASMARTAAKSTHIPAKDKAPAGRAATAAEAPAASAAPQSVVELLTLAVKPQAKGGLGYKDRAEVFGKLGIESATAIATPEKLTEAWGKLVKA